MPPEKASTKSVIPLELTGIASLKCLSPTLQIILESDLKTGGKGHNEGY